MRGLVRGLLAMLAVVLTASLSNSAQAQQPERRFALVIGNGAYASAPLPTAGNDAGLIAQTLQGAGFDVIGARDLDAEGLRGTFRDFLDKVSAAGPDAIVMVYLAGYGLQFEGDNFFVPIDARIERDIDVPLQALRLSDYLRPLAAMKSKGSIVVLDLARDGPFAKGGDLAGGLALVEPGSNMLVAFNAAPGTIGTPSQEPYGLYAEALAEMMRDGGLPAGPLFDRVRLRVGTASKGAMLPWHAGQLATPFLFFERGADAPPEVASVVEFDRRAARPIRDYGESEAYVAALERDTLAGYLDYLDVFASGPNAKRVRAIVAARREAITWRKARNADSPEAYWTYLDRYPRGPHAGDAKRRLAFLTAPIAPPPTYTTFLYDVPPPPREEFVYVERRVIYYGDPVFAFAPLPLVPVYFLPPPPRPRFFPAPPPPIGLYLLPVPVFVPVPLYVRAPAYVAPPPNNVVFTNIHNTTIYNNTVVNPPAPSATGTPPPPPAGAPAPGGPSAGTIAAGVAAATLVGATAARVALPPSLAKRPDAPPVTPAVVGPSGPAVVVPPIAKSSPVAPRPPTALPGSPTGAPLPPTKTATPPSGDRKAGPTVASTPGKDATPAPAPDAKGPFVKSGVVPPPVAKSDLPAAGKATAPAIGQPAVKATPVPDTRKPTVKAAATPAPTRIVTPPTSVPVVKPSTPLKAAIPAQAARPVVPPPRPAPVVVQPRPAPVVAQPRPAPVVAQPRPAPVVAQPRPAPVVAQPRPAPVVVQPRPAPVVAQPPPPPKKKPCGVPGTPPC